MCSSIYWIFVVVGDVWYSRRLICVWMFVSWMLFVVVGGGLFSRGGVLDYRKIVVVLRIMLFVFKTLGLVEVVWFGVLGCLEFVFGVCWIVCEY